MTGGTIFHLMALGACPERDAGDALMAILLTCGDVNAIDQLAHYQITKKKDPKTNRNEHVTPVSLAGCRTNTAATLALRKGFTTGDVAVLDREDALGMSPALTVDPTCVRCVPVRHGPRNPVRARRPTFATDDSSFHERLWVEVRLCVTDAPQFHVAGGHVGIYDHASP